MKLRVYGEDDEKEVRLRLFNCGDCVILGTVAETGDRITNLLKITESGHLMRYNLGSSNEFCLDKSGCIEELPF